MGKLDFAIDELEASGWSTLDTTGMRFTPTGRAYPGVERVTQEFSARSGRLVIRRVDLFDCFRAEWTDAHGNAAGAVVGQTEEEAAVFALARARRAGQLSPA